MIKDLDRQPEARTVWRRLLVESPRPRRIREHPKAHWFVVGTVCIGATIGQLDASSVVLAVPHIMGEFNTPIGTTEWVVLVYLLVLVASVTLVGRLADITGRKVLYMYGFGVFTLSSVACSVAPGLAWLIAARALQAVGAAMLQANSIALIAAAMPAGKLGRGIGVQGAAQAIGLALGPAVGGLLIGLGGWRLIFLINLPLGLIGMVLAWLLVPRSRLSPAAGTRVDWLGGALLTAAVGALICALSLASHGGPGPVAALLVACGLLAAGFSWRERRSEAPVIAPALLRRPGFRSGVAVALISYLTLFGVLLVVPLFLEQEGFTAAAAGLELAVLPVALGAVAPLAGHAADRFGAGLVTALGLTVVALGLLLLALFHAGAATIALALLVTGIGFGMFIPANNAAVMATAPAGQHGVAGGLLNMTRGLGTAIGVALASFVYGAAGAGSGGLRATGVALAAVVVGGVVVAAGRGTVR